jgi:integrase
MAKSKLGNSKPRQKPKLQTHYGDGYIRQRGTRSFQICVEGRRGPDGKRRQIWKTVRGTKTEAQAVRRALIQEVAAGTAVGPTKLTFGEFAAIWLEESVRVKNSRRTFKQYEISLRKYVLPKLGGMRMNQIDVVVVQGLVAAWQKDPRLGDSTVRRMYGMLHTAFGVAVRWKWRTGLSVNPADGVDLPPPQKPDVDMILPSVLRRLLEAVSGTPYYLATQIALQTGLRLHEVLGLRWRDVDLEGRTLTVSHGLVQDRGGAYAYGPVKTAYSRRTITFPGHLGSLLRCQKGAVAQRLGDEALVWGAQVCAFPDGGQLKPDTVSVMFRKLVDRAGLTGQATFHRLRHTHASLLINAGVHLKVIQARLGHGSIQTTADTYGHLLPSSEQVSGMGPSPLDLALEDVDNMLTSPGPDG